MFLSFPTPRLSLRLCYMHAHMSMHTWVCTFARSPTATALAVLQLRQPPFLLGPCASPLSHYFRGYRPSHIKHTHLFRDALPLRRALLVSRLCLLPSSGRRVISYFRGLFFEAYFQKRISPAGGVRFSRWFYRPPPTLIRRLQLKSRPNLRARESCGKYGKYLKMHANPAQTSNYGLWAAHAAFWRRWSDQAQ